MSNASSNQLFVRDGAGYDEVYPSSHKDPNSPSEEKSSSASYPFSRDKGLEAERLEDDSSEGLDDAEPPVQSVMGPEGLKEFIMLPIWTVKEFAIAIKESYFKTPRDKYQIPINIPLCLPNMSEKCYYKGVGVYEQMLKVGFRFPLSSLHRQLLQYLGLAIT